MSKDDEWDELFTRDPERTARMEARLREHIAAFRSERGVPAYHPTDAQPARCGGTEA